MKKRGIIRLILFAITSSNYDETSPCDENEFYNSDIPYIGVALGVKDIVKTYSTLFN